MSKKGKTVYLLEKAFIELGNEIPLDHITIEMVCERVGVKRQTFYYHYKDLNDLLKGIMIGVSEEREDLDSTTIGDARFLADTFSQNAPFFRNAVKTSYAVGLTSYIRNYIYTRSLTRLLNITKYKKLPREQIESVSRIISSIFVSELMYWATENSQESKEDLLHRFSVIMFNVEKMMVENALKARMHKKSSDGLINDEAKKGDTDA
ncbi:MAG: TetR/AcrR family transcriptional regulator [Bacilli bacterium]|jgi:AcrR family transcriptional regulator